MSTLDKLRSMLRLRNADTRDTSPDVEVPGAANPAGKTGGMPASNAGYARFMPSEESGPAVPDVLVRGKTMHHRIEADERDEVDDKEFATWDRRSVDDLPLDVLEDRGALAMVPALAQTVPERYRDGVVGARNGDGWQGAGENSEWWTEASARILAVDSLGKALVHRLDYNGYDGSEYERYVTMPLAKATSLIDDLKAEKAEELRLGSRQSGIVAQAASMPSPGEPVAMRGMPGAEVSQTAMPLRSGAER